MKKCKGKKGRPKPKGYRLAEALCALIVCVGMTRLVSSCKSAGYPDDEASAAAVVAEAPPTLVEQAKVAIAAWEAALETADPADDAPAQAAMDAALDRLAQAKAEKTGGALGGLLGLIVPGLGPLGAALGTVGAWEAVKGGASSRGRRLIAAAVKAVTAGVGVDQDQNRLIEAIRLLIASTGALDSTKASAAAAKATVAAHPAVNAEVTNAVKLVAATKPAP